MKELLEMMSDFAEHTFATQGSLMPMFHGMTADDKGIVLMTPWGDEDEKAILVERVRQIFAEHKVVRYAMLSEVWIATHQGPGMPTVMPRDRPDREEAVTLLVIEPPKKPVMARRKIVRPWDGSKPHLAPLEMCDEYGKLEGRMVELLA
jgi:hypothetical protein